VKGKFLTLDFVCCLDFVLEVLFFLPVAVDEIHPLHWTVLYLNKINAETLLLA
jgi:hypothetical protein